MVVIYQFLCRNKLIKRKIIIIITITGAAYSINMSLSGINGPIHTVQYKHVLFININ
jgi:hypothetical protein